MAKRNPFHRVRLVYRRSPILLKCLVLVALLATAAALISLRSITLSYQSQRQVLESQILQLQQENAELTQRIAELGSESSIRRIAMEELGLVDPNSIFSTPVSNAEIIMEEIS